MKERIYYTELFYLNGGVRTRPLPQTHEVSLSTYAQYVSAKKLAADAEEAVTAIHKRTIKAVVIAKTMVSRIVSVYAFFCM